MRAALLLVLALAACASPTQRNAQRAADAREAYGPMCADLGMQPETPAWSQCVVQMYLAEQDRNMVRGAAMMGAGAALIEAGKPPPRAAPTSCRWIGPNWVCG